MGALSDGRAHAVSGPECARSAGRAHGSHTRAHVIRAILEGVAFSLRDTFTIFGEMNVPVKRFVWAAAARDRLCGARFKPTFTGTRSNVEAEEGAAYGAAILAGVGAQTWPSVDDACDAVVRVARRVAPNAQRLQAADGKRYAAYRRIYPAMKSIFELITCAVIG